MRLSRTMALILMVLIALIYGRGESNVIAQPGTVSHDEAITNSVGQVASSGDLMALRFSPNGSEEFVVVIDSKVRSLAAYGLSDKNEWELKSVRNIDGDLNIDSWNGTLPKPSEIRKWLENHRR